MLKLVYYSYKNGFGMNTCPAKFGKFGNVNHFSNQKLPEIQVKVNLEIQVKGT